VRLFVARDRYFDRTLYLSYYLVTCPVKDFQCGFGVMGDYREKRRFYNIQDSYI